MGSAIFSARLGESGAGRTFFGEPEDVAADAAADSAPMVAFDPDSDGAIAVWRGANGAIEYAIRAPATAP